jgi:hypothetical protein
MSTLKYKRLKTQKKQFTFTSLFFICKFSIREVIRHWHIQERNVEGEAKENF